MRHQILLALISLLHGYAASSRDNWDKRNGDSLDEWDRRNYNPRDVVETELVIIGGGSSGTYAAIQLKDQGVDLVVVEKQPILGGHTDTYIDPATNIPINAGVIYLHDREIVRAYAQRLNTSLATLVSPQKPVVFANFQTGQLTPPPDSDPQAIATAFGKYAQIVAEKYAYLEDGFFLPNPVPEELLLPFGKFLTKNGLEILAFTFHGATQGWELWNQSTLYVIKLFGLALIQASAKGFLFTPNLQVLYNNAATDLGSRLILNSDILSVRRTNDEVRVRVQSKGKTRMIIGKRLLMSAPPVLENLRGWDLSDEEERLFNKFRATAYFDAVIKKENLSDDAQYANLDPSNPFSLPSLPGIFGIGTTPVPALRSVYYGTNAFSTIGSAKREILKEIRNLESTGVLPTGKTEIRYLNIHYPFNCQVSPQDIKMGFYADLYALQGKANTFWTGAAWMQQDSAMLWEFTSKLLPSITA
jgi:hypothetical protein